MCERMIDDALPLVSAIVPAFNAAGTLAETLRSVAAQTYGKLEIVIVDDGSSDATAELAAAFCADEPRARVISQPNRGLAAARNAGIAAARGAYVAPVDADDLWHPDKIAAQVAAAARHGERLGFVYCWSRLIDARSDCLGQQPGLTAEGDVRERLIFRNFVANGSALLFRRDVALAVGGYDERLREGCEDIRFQIALAQRHIVAAVPRFLVGYRMRPGSLARDYRAMYRSWRRVLELLEGEDWRVPPRVLRWNLAAREATIAEAAAWHGRPAEGAAFALRALRRDPLRTTLHFAGRFAQLAHRRLTRSRERPAVAFEALGDPAVALPVRGEGWMGAVRRLDARRMARLDRAGVGG